MHLPPPRPPRRPPRRGQTRPPVTRPPPQAGISTRKKRGTPVTAKAARRAWGAPETEGTESNTSLAFLFCPWDTRGRHGNGRAPRSVPLSNTCERLQFRNNKFLQQRHRRQCASRRAGGVGVGTARDRLSSPTCVPPGSAACGWRCLLPRLKRTDPGAGVGGTPQAAPSLSHHHARGGAGRGGEAQAPGPCHLRRTRNATPCPATATLLPP